MPILRIDTINKEKTLPNTDNADKSASFKRDFDSYTIELCDSAGNPFPSFCQPGFQNQNRGENQLLSLFCHFFQDSWCKWLYIQTREFASWTPPLSFICLPLPRHLICIYSLVKLFPDASLTWMGRRVITVRRVVLWMNDPLTVPCVWLSLSFLLFNVWNSHLVCTLLQEAPEVIYTTSRSHLAWTALGGKFLRLNKRSLNQKPGTQKPASLSYMKYKEFGNWQAKWSETVKQWKLYYFWRTFDFVQSICYRFLS